MSAQLCFNNPITVLEKLCNVDKFINASPELDDDPGIAGSKIHSEDLRVE